MKKSRSISLCVMLVISIVLVAQAAASTHTISNLHEQEKLNCPAIDAVSKKLHELSNKRLNMHDLIITLSRDISFKNLESTSLINNRCGAVATGHLMNSYYTEMNFINKAEEAHKRLIEFAKSNNRDAELLLCFSRSALIQLEERISYCESIVNIKDPNYKDIKLIARNVLRNAYNQLGEIEKLPNTHQFQSTQINKKVELENCMYKAEQKYNGSINNLCSDPKINCKIAIAMIAPKLLDPIINTLNREQEICIKNNEAK